jgi:hypothetical protein
VLRFCLGGKVDRNCALRYECRDQQSCDKIAPTDFVSKGKRSPNAKPEPEMIGPILLSESRFGERGPVKAGFEAHNATQRPQNGRMNGSHKNSPFLGWTSVVGHSCDLRH